VPAALLALALAASPAAGGAPTLALDPPRARPGDAVLLVVRGAARPPSASVAGRALSFFPIAGGHAALAGLPVETPPGPLPIEVFMGEGGEAGVVRGTLRVEPSAFPHRALEVQQRYVEPPPPEVERRIAEDRDAFARAFSQPPSPPLFRGRLAWPRRARVTASYGDQRTFNAVRPSQHYGLDLAGRVGVPVGAAQAGRVVLVRDCWASGKSVVVWHGAGLYTTYFHLSRIRVQEGQAVGRSERLGDVGATGRASGPHLHWGVRVGDLYVDPRSVLRLAFEFRDATPRPRAPRPARP